MTQPATGSDAPSGDATGAQSGAASDSGGPGTAQSGETTATATDSGAQAAQPAETVSKADFDRTITQLREADRKRQAAEAALQQLRDKDLPEAERVKRDYETAVSERDALKKDLAQSRIENAFLKQNKYKWRDPEVALAIADMSAVSIDDSGNVTGLEDSLKRLAAAKPWMLEADAGAGAEGSGTGTGTGRTPTTVGTPPMNGQPSTDRTDRTAAVKRWPAMKTRQRPS
jgi:hypothetical protein